LPITDIGGGNALPLLVLLSTITACWLSSSSWPTPSLLLLRRTWCGLLHGGARTSTAATAAPTSSMAGEAAVASSSVVVVRIEALGPKCLREEVEAAGVREEVRRGP
jgi:hypothetical protein